MSALSLDTHALTALVQQALSGQGLTDPASALGALALACGLDVTLLGLSASGTSRVLRAQGQLAGAVPFGAIQSMTITHEGSELDCIESKELAVPEGTLAALLGAGVERDAVETLYWDPRYGRCFRQRIASKLGAFVHLCAEGKIKNPTGFFLKMVRHNWLISRSYDPQHREKRLLELSRRGDEAVRRAAQEQAARRSEPDPEEHARVLSRLRSFRLGITR